MWWLVEGFQALLMVEFLRPKDTALYYGVIHAALLS
jgi:hypothetical protein